MLDKKASESNANAQRKDSAVLWMVSLAILIPIAFYIEIVVWVLGLWHCGARLTKQDTVAQLCMGTSILLFNWIALAFPCLAAMRVPRWVVTETLVIVSLLAVVVAFVYVQCNAHEFFEPGEFGITGALKAFLFLGVPLGGLTGSLLGYLSWKGYVPTVIAAGIIALGIAMSAVLVSIA
jgi:hypothetical protein